MSKTDNIYIFDWNGVIDSEVGVMLHHREPPAIGDWVKAIDEEGDVWDAQAIFVGNQYIMIQIDLNGPIVQRPGYNPLKVKTRGSNPAGITMNQTVWPEPKYADGMITATKLSGPTKQVRVTLHSEIPERNVWIDLDYPGARWLIKMLEAAITE